MIVDQQVTIAAPVDRVWDFMMDIPSVSRCVPGVESFEATVEYLRQNPVRAGLVDSADTWPYLFTTPWIR